MAWLDDTVWCKPTFTDLPDKVFRVWAHGLAYSSGFSTRGVLTVEHQRLIGANSRAKTTLIQGGLWEPKTDGSVYIHGWAERNGKRDERKEKDRARKREQRRLSAGQSAGQSTLASALTARVEGSEGLKDKVKGLKPGAHAPNEPRQNVVSEGGMFALLTRIKNGAILDEVDLDVELRSGDHQVDDLQRQTLLAQLRAKGAA